MSNVQVFVKSVTLTFDLLTHKSPYLWRIPLGVIMKSLIEFREGCENLLPTFEFYYGRTDGRT
jgi:hypothetical protein